MENIVDSKIMLIINLKFSDNFSRFLLIQILNLKEKLDFIGKVKCTHQISPDFLLRGG